MSLSDNRRQALENRIRTHVNDPEPCRELARELEADGALYDAARAQRLAATRRPDRPWDHFLAARLTVAADAQHQRNPKAPLPPEDTEDVRLPAAEEASIALRVALELDPDFGAAHRELARLDVGRARILRDEGQVKASAERAVQRCQEALKLDADDSETHRVLGDVQFHVLKAYPAARRHYARAIELAPDNADARAMLAATFLREGDRETAFRELTHALSIAPEHELAHEILKELR